ncbi:F-box domain-containing protein [Caenorhabditis elegans]|uniref:F-box domain-containing protein n=1 Tax=Caenorhabditis elegans TaxID=6239 RepID=Q4W513_CAEEL|nr:F-box domain-containing protein [Caenorhabditis elegans]CCD69711.1 F-box domain-containing protein [Caenorhabditis elegans]|eukprot:NP_001022263.1 F-box B protein [Caenorhabditis elegans]
MTALPFSRLPDSALRKSLAQMRLVEQLSLSVLSKNMKQLITMQKRAPNLVHINVMQTTSLTLRTKSIPDVNFGFGPHQSTVTVEMKKSTRSKIESTELNVPGFTVKKWIEHIIDVFSRKVQLNIQDAQGRSIAEVYELVKQINIVTLHSELFEIPNHFMKMFPSIETLGVFTESMPPSIYIRNLKLVRGSNMTLNNLLTSNCSQFVTQDSQFSSKDLNLLLKHWLRGLTPRLLNIVMLFSEANENRLVETIIFDGIIDYIALKLHGLKEFKVEKHDGTKATVAYCATSGTFFSIKID